MLEMSGQGPDEDQATGEGPGRGSGERKAVQARKKSTKINFLGPETARWGGGLPHKGVVAEKFVPSLESLSCLGFEERNLGRPGNFAGMSRTPGGVQKVRAKKFVRIFRSLAVTGRGTDACGCPPWTTGGTGQWK